MNNGILRFFPVWIKHKIQKVTKRKTKKSQKESDEKPPTIRTRGTINATKTGKNEMKKETEKRSAVEKRKNKSEKQNTPTFHHPPSFKQNWYQNQLYTSQAFS